MGWSNLKMRQCLQVGELINRTATSEQGWRRKEPTTRRKQSTPRRKQSTQAKQLTARNKNALARVTIQENKITPYRTA